MSDHVRGARSAASWALVTLVLAAVLAPSRPANASFPGADGKIVFSVAVGRERSLEFVNPDGSVRRRFARDGRQASWTADGRRLAFVASGRDDNSDIFSVTADGSATTNLTNSAADEADPSWPPDGRAIVYSKREGEQTNLYVMDADGSDQRALPGGEGGRDPVWSPDGGSIVFVRSGLGVRRLYRLDLASSSAYPLTDPSSDSFDPSWSPGGGHVAFARSLAGQEPDIVVMRADGSEMRAITASAAPERAPAWAPSGTAIAFAGRRNDTYGLFVAKLDGSSTARIARGRVVDVDWQACERVIECAGAQPTTTRVSVQKLRRKVEVNGAVDPASEGATVDVALKKRRAGEFVEVRRKRVRLTERSTFSASLRKPYSGRCKIAAVFRADPSRRPSRASTTFDCYYLPPGASWSDLKLVRGESPVSGSGPVRRFKVEVERRLRTRGLKFASDVEKVLYDDRSWGGGGRLGMKRVDAGPTDFIVTLATPATVDRLCAPLQTAGIYSCWNGARAVINSWRWNNGAESYGDRLRAYRKYVINHEVGHGLGHRHSGCPGAGKRAPVMMQQTKGVAPCRANPWPLRPERGPAP